MKNLSTLLIIILLCFSCIKAYSTPKYFSDNGKKVAPCPLYNKTITIPQGYVLGVNMKKQLDTKSIKKSDKYNVILNTDFIYSGKLIAPEGSVIAGTISSMLLPTENNQYQILIKFTNITTPDGQNIPISGIFNNNNPKGYVNMDKDGVLILDENTGIIIKQPVTYVPR